MLTGVSACSRVGSDNSQTFPESDDSDSDFRDERGLFLNLGSPSQCQGIVTAWHLQYELEDCGSDHVKTRPAARSRETQRGTFSGVFAVYRPVNNLTMKQQQHKVVPGSTKTVTISCQDDDDSDDRDERRIRSTDISDHDERRTRSTDTRDQEETIMLEEEERFMIQRGDVIAICLPKSIKKSRGIRRLHILEDIRIEAETPSVHEYDLRRDPAVNNCNFSGLQTISSQLLKARSRYRLHLYAEIAGKSLLATLA